MTELATVILSDKLRTNARGGEAPNISLHAIGVFMFLGGFVVALIGWLYFFGGLEDMNSRFSSYGAARDMRLGGVLLTLGGGVANIGFFFILFGWLSKRINAARDTILFALKQPSANNPSTGGTQDAPQPPQQ